MNYNLMPVKYFVDVVQTHGFISAARRNYVSETAVSSAIKKLEDELGQKLLNRSAGKFSLTPVGEVFYKRSVEIINLYSEIWHHPDPNPEKLLRVHFLQGFENDAALFASKIPDICQPNFDEENFDSCIKRLINGNYDILVGFDLAFAGNNKIDCLPFRKTSFDLLLNKDELRQYHGDEQQLAENSMLYMQNWKSTGITDIQLAMLKIYCQNGWKYKEVAEVNSFAAGCLNVNFNGGITIVPESFSLPQNCNNIERLAPVQLQKSFNVVIAMNPMVSTKFSKMLKHVTTLTYH